MAYDFTLTFSGLCVLLHKGGTDEHPTHVSVALTEASQHSGYHKHLPRLVYRAQDLDLSRSSSQNRHTLVPDPLGDDLGVLDLNGDLAVSDPSNGGFSASWNKSGPVPDVGEETSLAWLPSIYQINMNEHVPGPDPDKPHHGLTGIVANVELTGGALEAGNLTLNDAGDYQQYEFVYGDTTGGGADNQVLADKLHVRLRGLCSPVEMVGNGWVARFVAPSTGQLNVSITNLPMLPAPPTAPVRLDHFEHFYDMFYWTPNSPRPPRLRAPSPLGGLVTGASGVCPPARYG